MHYQVSPEIKIGPLGDMIPDTALLGKVLILTSKSLNKHHRIQEIFDTESCQVITDVEPELPFSYIEKTNTKRIKDTVIIILPHSLEYIKFSKNDNLNELVQSIKELSNKFIRVDCLIYYDDFKKKTYDEYFTNTNIKITT